MLLGDRPAFRKIRFVMFGNTDGLMRYKYRGQDPMHHDNVGLRLAMQRHIPFVYF
jgi:hypothetical protein